MRETIVTAVCLLALVLSAPIPTNGQLLDQNLSKVLSDDEIEAVEALKAAGHNRIQAISASINEQNLVNLHFSRQLTESDTPLLRRISRLGTLFFARETLSDDQLNFLEGVGMKGL
jgi:hypothetical protein